MIEKIRRLPKEPESRHEFSPSQDIFDFVSTDNRLIFDCKNGYKEKIEEIVWFTAWDGSREYIRKFIKEDLSACEFRWPYLEHITQSFIWSGVMPVSWAKYLCTKDGYIENHKKFELYCNMHVGLTGRYREFLDFRNLIDYDPTYWFCARVGDPYDCIISNNMCLEINKTLTRDIYKGNPNTCLTMLPYCNIIIEACHRRKPLGTNPPEWLDTSLKPLKSL
ncbi:hypothetical protein ACJRO0_13965 [Acetobacter oryzifermentans]|uniref:hypothetical protein n=1 Tax=Acetobacter TaxID=434 RepID=UPI001238DD97|nr:hypothetical protein [Acetobacter sp. DmW_136]KAA8383961.1 hypothetical protein FKW31_13660 [Acetobacter sp. DmW_136]